MTTRRPSDPYLEALAQANATIQRTAEAIDEFLRAWTSAGQRTEITPAETPGGTSDD